MLRRQLFDAQKSFMQLMDVKGEKFAYAVLKNFNTVKVHLKALQEDLKAVEMTKTEEFDKFLQERENIAIKHAKKNEAGEPITTLIDRGGQQIEKYVVQDEEAFKKEIDEFNETNKDLIDRRQVEEREYQDAENRILDEEIQVEFHKVKKLPETISAKELEAVSQFMFDEK